MRATKNDPKPPKVTVEQVAQEAESHGIRIGELEDRVAKLEDLLRSNLGVSV